VTELRTSALPAVLLSVTSGPDALLVLRSTARGGRRAGLVTAVGATVALERS
jgi:threonine/homoserine/homoserine lactone efflux protein